MGTRWVHWRTTPGSSWGPPVSAARAVMGRLENPVEATHNRGQPAPESASVKSA